MKPRVMRRIVILTSALLCAVFLATQGSAQSQADGTPYPKMAPLDQYLMDSNAEIALARSAAPDAVSRDATVVVMGRHGYETAIEGKNGFVCAVQRAWTGGFNSPAFWNPKIRGAVCYNPAAVRSVLPWIYMRTELVLAGLPKEQIAERLREAYAGKKLPALEPSAMSYMMSKQAYLSDSPATADGAHSVGHVMFYTPISGAEPWGANVPNSPFALLFRGDPEPFQIFIIATGTWSDGSPAPIS